MITTVRLFHSPVCDVHSLSSSGETIDLVDEDINVLTDDFLLLLKALLRECVVQKSTEPSVL